MSVTSQKPWYTLSIEETLTQQDVLAEQGLSQSEVNNRIKKYGPNELVERGGISPWRILFNQFTELMVIILIIAALVSLALGEYIDTVKVTLRNTTDDTLVNNVSMTNITAISNGFTFEYNYTLDADADAGTYDLIIWANDTDGNTDSDSSTFTVTNAPPTITSVMPLTCICGSLVGLWNAIRPISSASLTMNWISSTSLVWSRQSTTGVLRTS